MPKLSTIRSMPTPSLYKRACSEKHVYVKINRDWQVMVEGDERLTWIGDPEPVNPNEEVTLVRS